MEPLHRKIITDNMVSLVEKTNDIGLELLINYLVRDGVFNDEMVKRYRDSQDSMRKLNFFNDIQTRGPHAFRLFISALKEAGANELAQLLQPTNAVQATRVHHEGSGTQPSCLPHYMMENNENIVENLQSLQLQYPNAVVALSTTPLIVKVELATERLDKNIPGRMKVPHYAMGSRPKGLALIINIYKFIEDVCDERLGAHIDSINMYELFKQLGYETEKYENLTKSEFLTVLRKFTGRKEHSRVSSCMVAIMSHGNMTNCSTVDLSTVIYAADGLAIKYTDIIDKFSSENCPGLIQKPKVFFFQSCRGSERNHGVRRVSYTGRHQTDGIGQIPMDHPIRNVSDMLIGHATPRGYEAIRDRYTGSWFIQTVVETFMQNAWDTEVQDMFKMVDNTMRQMVSEDGGLQTTCVEDLGFHKMFICPGLYDEDEDATDASTSGASQL